MSCNRVYAQVYCVHNVLYVYTIKHRCLRLFFTGIECVKWVFIKSIYIIDCVWQSYYWPLHLDTKLRRTSKTRKTTRAKVLKENPIRATLRTDTETAYTVRENSLKKIKLKLYQADFIFVFSLKFDPFRLVSSKNGM